jgi:hypothetical protein
MFDRPDPRPDRSLDALGSMGMGRHVRIGFAAVSTAARISASVNSGAPGFVPEVSTAPVARTLMKSAPYI